jgi:hypothetical protein
MHTTKQKPVLPDSITTKEDIAEYKIYIKTCDISRFQELLNTFKFWGYARPIPDAEFSLRWLGYIVTLTEEELLILKLSFNLKKGNYGDYLIDLS